MRSRNLRLLAYFTISLAAALSPSRVIAQVDCSDPNNLCTGDPCIIGPVDVQSPCVVNFGPRTVVVDGKMVLLNAAVLDFTANVIEINEQISGRNPDGSQITLTATSGDITVDKAIDGSGRVTPGTITLDASGNVNIDARLTSRPRGGSAPGGAITVHADNVLTITSHGRVETKGSRHTQGGSVQLSGDAGVSVAGGVDASGGPGGSIQITSSAGAVSLEEDLRVFSKVGVAGSISITASGAVTSSAEVLGNGVTGGADITVTAASVDFDEGLFLRATQAGAGGTADIVATGDVSVERVRTDGNPTGGCIRLKSNAGNIMLSRDNEADAVGGDGIGGRIVFDAAGDVTVPNGVDVEVDAATGGSISINGTNLTLAGDFNMRGDTGGAIEAIASGNLTTASGTFRAETGGCIGLSAGGTLDLSGAFDVTVTASCTLPPSTCGF
jgi:hypothetical protein